jgi:hypothetical protein
VTSGEGAGAAGGGAAGGAAGGGPAGTSREGRVASPATDALASSISAGASTASASGAVSTAEADSSDGSRGAVLRARGAFLRRGLAGAARRLAVRLPGAPRVGAESASDASMTSASRVLELATGTAGI